MSIRISILKVLAYFDLFDYPVSLEEIHRFLDRDIDHSLLEKEIEALVTEQRVFRMAGFYSLQENPALAERRVKGNRRADELLPIAARISRLLYLFPYVRGVGISGSLSKHFADEEADIDYFIITRKNRLWIARSFMHLLKKLSYLRGRQHHYCMNYYIDEDALEIKEKNIFTAMELFTLLPFSGNSGLVSFFDANDWACDYFPHYRFRQRKAGSAASSPLIKTLLEKLFDTRLGDYVDNYLHRLTNRRWQKKEKRGDLNIKGSILSMQNDKHFSRPNPTQFQQKILAKYKLRVKELADKWGMVTSS